MRLRDTLSGSLRQYWTNASNGKIRIQRKESQMDHGQLSMVADKFQWVFSESLLNACGTDVKFCRRMRTITPFRLGLALGCRTFLSCISKGFGGFCSRLLRLS